jgi:hypothetical protein
MNKGKDGFDYHIKKRQSKDVRKTIFTCPWGQSSQIHPLHGSNCPADIIYIKDIYVCVCQAAREKRSAWGHKATHVATSPKIYRFMQLPTESHYNQT